MSNSDSINISKVVRNFYEKYPYPEPVESLEKYRQNWQDVNKLRADYHLYFPDKAYREDFSILVAGCGTSQAAKHAMRWPNAKVTGIDFSLNSISCTEKLKKKYKLDNLEIVQLEIEKVIELGTTFDQIICTGVLHHLSNPDTGLKALHNVLKPDGAMHLMVYASYGRTGIYMIQEFCRMLDIQANEEGIRDLIRSLKALPPGHPLETLIRNSPDFQYEAALADALLNPQDRAYSVPELFEFINKGEMKFGRWIKQAPYSSRCGVIAQLPQAEDLQKLSPEEQYTVAELFRGTMVRHSLIAYRSDFSGGTDSVNFDNDSWLDFIPIRLPDTLCIQEQLPVNAVGILINKTQYRDLYMPVDANEKQMFDNIDGKNSVKDIIERTNSFKDKELSSESLCYFFEKLWWNDQIVFDTSKS